MEGPPGLRREAEELPVTSLFSSVYLKGDCRDGGARFLTKMRVCKSGGNQQSKRKSIK